jgi:hypothetical protein
MLIKVPLPSMIGGSQSFICLRFEFRQDPPERKSPAQTKEPMAMVRHQREGEGLGVFVPIAPLHEAKNPSRDRRRKQAIASFFGAAGDKINRPGHRQPVSVQLARPAAGRHEVSVH